MDYADSFAISASGLNLEKLRLDATASNLANMHTASKPGTAGYQPLRVFASPSSAGAFGRLIGNSLGVVTPHVAATPVPPRMAHEPGHPDADDKGMVAYPGIDHVGEMMNMTTALRAYQANVSAINATKVMALKALEIGAGQ